MTRVLGRGDPTLERLLAHRIADRAPVWFPGEDLGAVRLRIAASRPSGLMYSARVGGSAVGPSVVVKVRNQRPSLGRPERPISARPMLSPNVCGPRDLTRLEYEGLGLISRAVAPDSRFLAVRALDHLPEHAALIMGFVCAPTVRQILMRESRFDVRWPSPRSHYDLWHRVGAWVGVTQAALGTAGRAPRRQHRDEVLELFTRYGSYLTAQTGTRAWTELARSGIALAEDVFPQDLPVAAGHGDYAPRNAFRCSGERLAVFDPVFRWATPIYEDLARFLVGVRLLGLQVHSHGAALGSARVEAIERNILEGYQAAAGAHPAREAAVRCYELLLLMDKWSALVASTSTGTTAGRIRGVSLRLAERFLERQSEDVLARAVQVA